MKLNNLDVYNILLDQGIKYLYHANTVATACTYIENGGLLSRGAVEHLNLNQTPQSSDEDDKRFDVWNDIFLDSIDLHGKFPRQNYYGPVLFKFNLDLLKDSNLPELHITKDNPIRWNDDMSTSDKYFQNINEFKKNYKLGSYKEMITLKNTLEILPFNNYLVEIILDNPMVLIENESLREKAKDALNDAIKKSSYDYSKVTKTIRKCNPSCFCKDNYLRQHKTSDLKRLFTYST